MELGYRDPMTYKKAGTIASLQVIAHNCNIRTLVEQNKNEHLTQYLWELMNGGDPRKSKWWNDFVR